MKNRFLIHYIDHQGHHQHEIIHGVGITRPGYEMGKNPEDYPQKLHGQYTYHKAEGQCQPIRIDTASVIELKAID